MYPLYPVLFVLPGTAVLLTFASFSDCVCVLYPVYPVNLGDSRGALVTTPCVSVYIARAHVTL